MNTDLVAAFAISALSEVASPATRWDRPGVILLQLLAIVFLVALNGFFVASEFRHR